MIFLMQLQDFLSPVWLELQDRPVILAQFARSGGGRAPRAYSHDSSSLAG